MKTIRFFSSIQRFFDFNSGERRGILVLTIILFILILFRVGYSYIYLQRTSIEMPEDVEKKIETFYARQKHIEDSLKSVYASTYSEKKINFYHIDQSIAEATLHPFPFNPNNLPESTWKELGLTDKQIRTIKNYEAKGGKFYSKEDLKKIYCISEYDYRILEPYIHIPQENPIIHNYKEKKNKFSAEPVELNTADSIRLQTIPGIGAKTASRIIIYRDKLGGFVYKEQLLEVYGIDSNRYQQIEPYLLLTSTNIKKININTADIKEMIKHPYIDYYLAKSIFTYRQKNGNFKSLEEMKTQTHIYNDLFTKLKPYLTTK